MRALNFVYDDNLYGPEPIRISFDGDLPFPRSQESPREQLKVVFECELRICLFMTFAELNYFQQEMRMTEANSEMENMRENLKLADIQREESQAAAQQLADYWQQHCNSLKEENEKLLGEYQCISF